MERSLVNSTVLTIGALARRAGCPVETIRYYERAGLLPAPARTRGNYRAYGQAHLERLAFIRRCRSLDMSLEEIRVLLRFHDAPEENCTAVNELLDAHIGHVAVRIAELGALERQLKTLRQRCRRARKARSCGILNELAQPATAHSSRAGHLPGAHGRH